MERAPVGALSCNEMRRMTLGDLVRYLLRRRAANANPVHAPKSVVMVKMPAVPATVNSGAVEISRIQRRAVMPQPRPSPAAPSMAAHTGGRRSMASRGIAESRSTWRNNPWKELCVSIDRFVSTEQVAERMEDH